MAKLRIIFRALIGCSLLVTAGCGSIHQFPDIDPQPRSLVNVRLNFNGDLTIPSHPASPILSRADHIGYEIRYVVEAYKAGTSELVARAHATAASAFDPLTGVGLQIPAQNYTIVALADYVPTGTTDDFHYLTSSLNTVTIRQPYTGADATRDVFFGTTSIDLTSYVGQRGINITRQVNLKRPVGVIEFIATDVVAFTTRSGSTRAEDIYNLNTRFTYPGFLPTVFNATTGQPTDSEQGIWFSSGIEILSPTEALLGFDYIFVNGDDSNATVEMEISNNMAVVLNNTGQITLPVSRDKVTTVRGEFLTKTYDSGVAIDPGFGGDINIVIPD